MNLTPEQIEAVQAPCSVAVTAGAGTGKTLMLTERYLFHLSEQGLSPLEVVAVTFTEKAAAELRARIRKSVAKQFLGQEDILAELEAAQISTIHSLAARICRDHYDLAGISPDFAVLDESETVLWLTERFDAALDDLPLSIFEQVPYSVLRKTLWDFVQDPIAADRALNHTPDEWQSFIEESRTEAVSEITQDECWLDAKRTLTTHSGMDGDKLEDYRRRVLAAIQAIDGGSVTAEHFNEIISVNLRYGSLKKWPNGGKEDVSKCLGNLRDLVKKSYDIITLKLGEADQQLAEMLPSLRVAFDHVNESLADAKRRAHVLDYSDLEVYALAILRHEEAQAHYAKRWKAYLVDEFQDTNPVQGELLNLLTRGATISIVGDEKQSIYGFRRADSKVFQSYREQIITDGGKAPSLGLSFRTHLRLVDTLNSLFSPVLGVLHQPLSAHRIAAPHEEACLTASVVVSEEKVSKSLKQRVEAKHLAGKVKRLLDDGVLVYDKNIGDLRPIRFGDIAFLSRTWNALDFYGEALASAGIPAVNAGGGNLLEIREVKDAIALLRFLADPLDDIALATVLRSPFFAVSDIDLFNFSRRLQEGEHWWTLMNSDEPTELDPVAETLKELLKVRRKDSPARLLQLANRMTGYCAVIANLPDAARREADWRGFLEFVQKCERTGYDDVFSLSRFLKQLAEAEVQLERPPLEAQNAVSLMTIHAAKGLEWPVVVIPDLSHQNKNDSPVVLFDPDFGVALKSGGTDDNEPESAVYMILKRRRKAREEAEARRVLYVALTRARDQVLLTSAEENRGGLKLLQDGLALANVALEPILFSDEDAVPQPMPDSVPYEIPGLMFVEPAGVSMREIPITSLSEYALCPLRFRFRYMDGHPGLGEGPATGRRVGKLMHKAIELGIKDVKALRRYDPALQQEHVEEALNLAQCFQEDSVFSPFREVSKGREQLVNVRVGQVMLQGVIDLVGDDFIMDFKSDQEMSPQHHRFQLWAYAQAAGKPSAHIAYLRHGHVHTFASEELDAVGQEVQNLLAQLHSGHLASSPSEGSCCHCPYGEICPDRHPGQVFE
jgi:ATP-dependent helicase/nuclease subunit A